MPKTPNKTPEYGNIKKAPEIQPEVPETLQETPIPAPYQRSMRRNSLEGLPQYNKDQFGSGKCQHILTLCINAKVAYVEGAFMLEEEGELEPGGMELNIDEAEWFGQAVEQAMVISEDKPSLTKVLGGNECSAWYDAIDVELIQMEKVNAWVPVIQPQDANIIPSQYIFCHKCNETGHIVCYKVRLVVNSV